MKRSLIKIFIVTVLISSPVFTVNLFSQGEPPLPGGSPLGGPGGPVGANAPIDGGLSIMLVLGAFYGMKKTFKSGKEK